MLSEEQLLIEDKNCSSFYYYSSNIEIDSKELFILSVISSFNLFERRDFEVRMAIYSHIS